MLEQQSFGYWLKLKRKALDLTREELAERVGYSAATIRKIEDEERRPSAQIVERIADIFNIPPDERTSFMQYARGDLRYAPGESPGEAPWRISHLREQPSPNIFLATFLFTDIEGSAKLWDNAAEKMKIALQRHHDILQEAIVSNGGEVFQIVGDAFCAAFPTVLAAVLASVTAQHRLYQEPWDLPFPVRVRMGIHTGETERTSSNRYASNPTLNRVARILSAGHGGQVLLSLATKDLVKDALPANTELRDMGEHYLRNLMHPEHLFQLIIEGLPSDFPPLNTLTRHHNLPIQLTSFVAREKEIALVREYLAKDDRRLVTLIGPPGIGKTRLSIESARESLANFPDGVFFVALAPLEDPSLVASTITQTLGFVETKSSSPLDQLKDGIEKKRMLLVLDNAEHLIEVVATLVSDLLSSCPRLKILITSREALRIAGEWLYSVPVLSVPKEITSVDVEAGSQFSALTLFAERARAVRSDFILNAENFQPVASICAQLDGLPLAIELIAARMRLMSPQALLERLTGQFVLTANGMRAVSARQKTLNEAIRWSYNLLSAEEQNLFVDLSVFSGGFTLSAAEAMFSSRVTAKPVSDLIASLMDKSLLQRFPNEHNEPRFTMLVTLQEFARERLQDMGAETEIRNLHLAYFLELAEQADREVHGPAQVAWMDRLDRELDNFRAALDWGLSSQQTKKLLQLFTALGWTWMVRWSSSESRSWLDKIRARPDFADYPETYARILNVAVHQEWIAANFGEARSFVGESRAIWLALGINGERGLAEALYLSGMIAMQEGDYTEAVSSFEQSFELFQKCGDKWGMAFTRFLTGNVASQSGEDASALVRLKQSLDLFHALGDPWGMARVFHFLGQLSLEQGNYENARLYFDQHLEIDEGLRFKQGTVVALHNLGYLYRHQRDYDQAEQYYEKSLALCHEYRLTSIERSNNVYSLGMLALHRNKYPVAMRHFTNYFNAAPVSVEKITAADLLTAAAAIAAGMNQPERAAKSYGAAQVLFETTDYRIPPFDQAEFDRHIQIAREQLGEAKFEAFAAEGRAMTMEQAVTYALENNDE